MTWMQRLFSRKRLDTELDAELRFHVDQLTADLVRQGLTPEHARREANIRFGRNTQISEECRDARGTAWVQSLLQDVRYALRVLTNSPTVSLTAVLTLALAIGANTLIFSGVHSLLLKPLPYPEEDRLFTLLGSIPGENGIAFSTREFQLWQGAQQSFSSFGGYVGNGFTLTGRGEPLALFGTLATPGVFSALAVPPALGRVIDASDARLERAHVVLLSDGLWREKFAADPNAIGETVYLNSESYRVIGVMPWQFTFPGPQYRLWIPAVLGTGLFEKFPDAHFLRTVGRLRPQVSASQLAAEVAVLGKRVAELDRTSRRSVSYQRLPELIRGPIRRPLLALMAAVGFVLLIACANVAGILLARGTARHREFSVRVALGAARSRLVQQLVIEATMLAGAGGGLGIVLAYTGVRLLRVAGAIGLPGVDAVEVDAPVLVFAVCLSIATGIAFGLAPAVLASHRAVYGGLRQGTRSAGDRRANRVQRALVTVEIALGVMLLAGAGLFAHSFVRLASVNPGFRPDHVLTASVALDEQNYADEGQDAALDP